MNAVLEEFQRRNTLAQQRQAQVLAEANAKVSPEEAARRAQIARRYGVSPDVAGALPLGEHAQEVAAAIGRQPRVGEWIKGSGERVALARGGMGNLADTSEHFETTPAPRKSFIDRAVPYLRSASPFGMALAGAASAAQTVYRARQDITPTNVGRSLEAGMGTLTAGIQGAAQAAFETMDEYSPLAQAERALFGQSVEGWAAQRYSASRQSYERYSDERRPETKTQEGQAVLSGVESIPGSLAALVGGAYFKSAGIAASLMGVTVGGQSYGRGRDFGLSNEHALLYGSIDAAIEAGTEFLPFSRLLPNTGVGFGRRLAGTLVADVPGEIVATLGQNLNQFLNMDMGEGKTWQEFIDEQGGDIYETAIASAVGSGALASAVSASEWAARRAGRRIAATQGADDTERFTRGLADLAKASTVLQRDPQSFEDFVRSAAEETGGPTTVFIEADQLQNVLNQSDLTVEQVYAMTGKMPEELQLAAERGEDIAIPVEEYASRIAAQPINEQLMPHLRLDPDDMSRAQAETFMQGAQEEFAKDAEAQLAKLEAGDERAASRQRVEERILGELNTARRFTEDTNRVYASIVGAFFDTQSAKVGQTAEQLAETYGLAVQSGEVAQPTFDQPELQGLPPSSRGGFAPAQQAAEAYMSSRGEAYTPPTVYSRVDPERAARIAAEYEAMPHAPNDPAVREAYDAMVEETLAQYQVIKATGLQIDFVRGEDPYNGNPWGAVDDVRQNNHIYVFSTEDGYGQGGIPAQERAENPMLQVVEGEEWSGQPVLVNDVFRLVHDYFGHIKTGVGFRADGEENAWRAHSAMYSPLARRAMTTETRGQNSWLNFGPHGATNRTARVEDTVFAEQKIGLLPEWVSTEGAADDTFDQRPLNDEEALAAGERMASAMQAYGKRNKVRTELRPSPFGNPWVIELTDLYAAEPGGGNGTKVMQQLVNMADESGLQVILKPESQRNKGFYERFGFVSRDTLNGRFMVRYPVRSYNQSAAPLQTLPMGVRGTGPGGRVRNWDLGEALTLRHRAEYGRALDPNDPGDYEIALRSLLEDYENQKSQPDNGEAWYSDDIAEALEITKRILPELEDPVRRDIFLTATAILSPRQGPVENWSNAIAAMTGYSIEGRFATTHPDGTPFGVPAHATGLGLFEHLINQYGEIGALVWLSDEHTGAEMEALRRSSGLFRNKADKYLPSETNKTERKLGVYIFGPKVGDFMLNSAGLDQNAVTVDLWMARTYNRVIGRLTDVNEKTAAEGGLADTMRGKAERAIVKRLVRDAAERAGIAPSAMQAALWYFEQRLYRNHGIRSESTSFSDAAREAAFRRGIPVDGVTAQGSVARSDEAARADLDEGLRVYNQDGLNPLDAFKRESLYPARATRHEDDVVYADVPAWYPDRLARIADAIGAARVEAVPASDPRLARGVPLWFSTPPVNPDGTVTLHHWGPAGITETDPTRWGESDSLPASERSAITSGLPRTYFGIASGQPGGYIIEFPSRTQYEARVPAERLYDIAEDRDGLKPAANVAELERKVKAAGYLGYWTADPQLGLVATVFEPLAVQPARAQVLHQDAVFFSALERAIEKTATTKASAQQWEATLRKTPGVKQEELEWTGLLEFLSMAEDGVLQMAAPVTEMDGKWWVQFGPEGMVQAFDDKEAAFAFARQHRTPAKKGAITREQLLEVVRGAGIRVDEVLLSADFNEELRGIWSEDSQQWGVWDGNDWVAWFDTPDEVDTYIDNNPRPPGTQFASWSSDPRNDTYRELLITLPVGKGRNPNRAPSTHWDTDGVIAHVRFMDKIDADGKRVLFLEEVQSDWHQKGRDQGYMAPVQPEVVAEARAAERAARDAFASAVEETVDALGGVGTRAWSLNVSPREAVGMQFEVLSDLRRSITPERYAELKHLQETWNLRIREANAAIEPKGIPNAPFKTTWPQLVMKRTIRWAAEHGYERIAWTTGEQQAERYNLGGAVGNIAVFARDGEDVVFNVDGTAAFNTIASQEGVSSRGGVLRASPDKLRELFGNDVAERMLSAEPNTVLEGDDLTVGGEGMKAFYDRNLVNITNSLIKKYGAKVGVVPVVDDRAAALSVDGREALEAQIARHRAQLERIEAAIAEGRTDPDSLIPAAQPDGLRQRIERDQAALARHEAAVRGENSIDQWGFDITPELADAAMGGFPLFQRTGAPRGQIAFAADITQAPSVITLLRGADLSTFVHELGHFFFEVTNHMASRAGAPTEIVADRDAMLRYVGVESVTEWENRTPEQRREGHERIARSFEAYLFEGNAPSLELRGVFAKLRSWMLQVYRTITRLNVELTDEVRGVFDRMLASEEAIDEAEADAELRPLFADKPEGMTDADWEEYQRLNADATTEAAKQLEGRSLRDMRYAGKAVARELKRLQRQVKDQRDAMREEVEEEFSEMPIYRLMRDLRSKEVDLKLHTGILKELLGLGNDPLPDAFRGMTNQDGVHPQQVAEMYGFTSADHMAKDLLFATPFREAVDAETDARMRERYGELNTPEEVEEAARAAVHNEVRSRFVATELAALQNAAGKKRVLAAAARRMAEGMIARVRIRDLRPSQYEAAERRAARAAAEAGTTNLDEAIRQKRNQLLQFNLAKAAHEARDETKKARDYLAKFANKNTRANIDVDFLDQIDQLMERYELRQISNREADRRRSLQQWVEKMQADGFEPAIDPETLADIGRKPWRELTVEEMRGIVDAVRNIEHLGRMTKKLLTAKDKADLDTAAGEMGEAVRTNASRSIELPTGSRSWWELVKSGAADFFAMHRKMANLVHVFDGNQYGGVFWERFIRPMNERGDWQTSRNLQANERLAALFAPLLSENTSRREFEPAIGKSISLEDRLMVALNMGNEDNLQRLLDGDLWTYEQAMAVVAPLQAHHWDFVESVWREIDSYWPEIAAKERRVSGVEPEKVEARPFQIELGGELRLLSGGYFPIKYDPDKSSKAEADDNAEVLRQMTRGLYTNAQTRRGHTKARVNAVRGRPLRKDFGVIFGHVNQVIHDLAWHEYLIDANRLLRHGAVDSAIREHYGPETLRWMRKGLEDIAIGDLPSQNAFEKSIRHLRTGVSISAMGWSIWTSLLQPTGLTQSMSRIGSRYVMKGIGDLFSNPAKMNEKLEWIYENSPFMRNRSNTMQREINEIRNHIGPKSPIRKTFDRLVPGTVSGVVADSYFYMIGKAQLIADIPTWLGQYQKSLEAGEQHERAVAIADQAVIDSQGSGQIKDLAGIQRGSELMKLFTNFYSYFSATMNLMSDRTSQLRRVGARDLPYYMVDMALLSFVPATLASLMYSVLRTEGEDEEELLQQVAQDNLVYMLGLMVGVREIGSALAGVAGYTGPAGARFFGEVGRFGKQVAQGEADEALARSANSMLGILLHYPSTQLDRTMRGAIAVSEGEAGPEAVLLGPPVGQ